MMTLTKYPFASNIRVWSRLAQSTRCMREKLALESRVGGKADKETREIMKRRGSGRREVENAREDVGNWKWRVARCRIYVSDAARCCGKASCCAPPLCPPLLFLAAFRECRAGTRLAIYRV